MRPELKHEALSYLYVLPAAGRACLRTYYTHAFEEAERVLQGLKQLGYEALSY
jgi:hypothetical protein